MTEIINNEDNKFYIEQVYAVEDYLTFNIKIKSGDFSGASNFCISKENLNLIFNTLSNMYKKLEGRCEIFDNDSDSYITIDMNKLGHLNISGQIGGSYEDHFMKFKFSSDQTILLNLIQLLKPLF